MTGVMPNMLISVYFVIVLLASTYLNVCAMLDPTSPTAFNHRYEIIDEIRYHYVDEGPKDGPVVVLLHGFPDLWYGWRHQIKFLANRGYRVICPDLRGYGETDSPHCPPNDLSIYSLKSVSNDIVRILDMNNIGKFVVIGHDWGGHLAWRFYLHHPERLLGVGSFCTPYVAPMKKYIPLEKMVEMRPRFAYQLVLRKPETDKYFDENVGLVLRSIYQHNDPKDDAIEFMKSIALLPKYVYLPQPKRANFMTDQELQYYIDKYTERGFHSALNWYRTLRINWENEVGLPSMVTIPSLMITAGRDMILPPHAANSMHKYFTNLTKKHIEGGAHWILAEQPNLSNQYIAEFLGNLTQKL